MVVYNCYIDPRRGPEEDRGKHKQSRGGVFAAKAVEHTNRKTVPLRRRTTRQRHGLRRESNGDSGANNRKTVPFRAPRYTVGGAQRTCPGTARRTQAPRRGTAVRRRGVCWHIRVFRFSGFQGFRVFGFSGFRAAVCVSTWVTPPGAWVLQCHGKGSEMSREGSGSVTGKTVEVQFEGSGSVKGKTVHLDADCEQAAALEGLHKRPESPQQERAVSLSPAAELEGKRQCLMRPVPNLEARALLAPQYLRRERGT